MGHHSSHSSHSVPQQIDRFADVGRHDRSRECHVFAMRGLEVAAQRNAQSTSTRLKTLGMVGVPYKYDGPQRTKNVPSHKRETIPCASAAPN